jgi:hypothetical protein
VDHPCALPGTSFRRPAALVLLLLLAALLPVIPAAAADDAAATPLTVRLIRMSPAVIPTKGHVVLAGTVTNSSDEPWIAVNVHPFISGTPITSREQLAAAADSSPSSDVGERLTEVGQFDPIGDIQPAQTLPFKIVLPVEQLPISHQPGVYWIGVHALGQNSKGRDQIADGRARTFIPLVTDKAAHTSVALVVPVRDEVSRDARGRLLATSAWSDTLSPSGRLGRIARFVTSAGPTPLTMLIDPAVMDAVSDLADGNPALSLGKPEKPKPSESSSPSESPSRSGTRIDAVDRATAKAWLTDITAAARRHVALGLGYADPDVAALHRRGFGLFSLSNPISAETFNAQRIDAVPTVAPPTGWLSDDVIARLTAQTTVLVSDHAAPRARTRWRTPGGQDLIFSDQEVSSGGPAPTPPLDALALRQRIVADAALRASDNATDPLVVELPPGWDPGSDWQSARFFSSLKLPWLNLVALGPNNDPGTPTFDAALGYPDAQRKLEVPDSNVATARRLTQTATALTQLLQSDNDVAHDLAGIALNAVSVQARTDAVDARIRVITTNTAFRDRIGKVEVLGTDFVTLSGGSGTLAVTLVNGLDQPVLVGVEPHTSTPGVTIQASKPVRMSPGERTVLRLKAKASSIGVSQVVLTPVTQDGTELGTPLVFSLRTSQVGKTIWFVLIGFGALLVVMILRRIRRGLVEHRWRGRG